MGSPNSSLATRVPLWGTRLGYAVVATVAVATVVLVALATGLLTIPPGTVETAKELLEQYGVLAVFVAFVLEGAMLLRFAPNESIVPLAVLGLADSTADVALIVAVAVVGATIGQTALFLVARRGGRELLLGRGWIRVSEDSLDRFDGWFDRWGPVAVPASNTMLFVRGLVTVPAGFSEMDARVFVALSALGTLVFETLLAALALHAPAAIGSIL
jgi:Uncharacterized membrane-associated protein